MNDNQKEDLLISLNEISVRLEMLTKVLELSLGAIEGKLETMISFKEEGID